MFEGERIRYIKGMFADIAKTKVMESLRPAVIVNLDCDLYGSTVDALEMIKPKMQQGTVMMMDDYNAFCAAPDKGQRRALKEFLEKYPAVEAESWFPYSHVGQAFILHVVS